jgi:hypothetical protein
MKPFDVVKALTIKRRSRIYREAVTRLRSVIAERKQIPSLLFVGMRKLGYKRIVERRLRRDSFERWHHVGIHRDAHDVARHFQAAMSVHERCWILIVIEIAGESGVHDSDTDILMHFEM